MSATPNGRVFLSSWLDKKMEWRFVYEQRYFILDGTRLSYRLEEHGAEKRFGTITSFEPWRETAKDETSKGYCFTVWLHEGGSWYLRAATREIYDSWFSAIMTVLVPSTNPSAAPSENGGEGAQHSRVASSVTKNSAMSSASASPYHLEDESIGRSPTPGRKPAAVANRYGAPNGNTLACLSQPQTVDGTRQDGAFSSEDTPSLTAAALTVTAHRAEGRTTSVGADDVVLLSSIVEKEKAWRGQWKPRYMELREGRLLIIRSSPTSTSERQRYVVESVDRSPLETQATWMLISTSTGDRFWVRFGSVEERERWLTVCGRMLLAECSWHWMPLAEDDTGRSWRLRQATSGAYDDLHVHYHCTAMVPSFRDNVWCPSLFVFGGSDCWCKPLFNPQARAFLPHADATHVNGRLAALELAGPHLVRQLQPAPFQEAPHALVRPLPRYGATLTCLPVKDTAAVSGTSTENGSGDCGEQPPTAATTVASSAGLLGARVVLLGGHTCGGYQSPETELWNVWCSKAACESGVEMRWDRHDLPSYELPNLAFHDAVYVPWGGSILPTSTDTSATINEKAAPHDGFLLVTGGLDVECRCRSECYAVVWNYKDGSNVVSMDAEERIYTAVPTAYAFGQLPSPRAFHRMVVLEDGTVVLVGGRGVENAAVSPFVLTLAPEVWRSAAHAWGRPSSSPAHPANRHHHQQNDPPVPPSVEPASHQSENWCSISSKGENSPPQTATASAENGNNDEDVDEPASQWLRAHFDDTPLPAGSTATTSTAQQLVKALPSEMGDVAVAATGRCGRVVVMGQVTQPQRDVKLYLLDFEPINAEATKISSGEQFPPGTRRVRCHEVLLFVGAVPNRLVGITAEVFNGYLYVIGGCTVDKSKTNSHELCGPLRILLE